MKRSRRRRSSPSLLHAALTPNPRRAPTPSRQSLSRLRRQAAAPPPPPNPAPLATAQRRRSGQSRLSAGARPWRPPRCRRSCGSAPSTANWTASSWRGRRRWTCERPLLPGAGQPRVVVTDTLRVGRADTIFSLFILFMIRGHNAGVTRPVTGLPRCACGQLWARPRRSHMSRLVSRGRVRQHHAAKELRAIGHEDQALLVRLSLRHEIGARRPPARAQEAGGRDGRRTRVPAGATEVGDARGEGTAAAAAAVCGSHRSIAYRLPFARPDTASVPRSGVGGSCLPSSRE